MSQVLPIMSKADRLKVKIAAIALAEIDGWEFDESSFDWVMLVQPTEPINPRSIDFVRRANAVVQAISDL